MVFSGILEDSSFKTTFVSHKIKYPLIRNSVYKFYSAYIHEFENKSLLLIVTEQSLLLYDSRQNNCTEGWGWDLRIC